MNHNICRHYIAGVSIGTMREPTAIAIVEQETRTRGNWETEVVGLRLRHLARAPLDMTYPDQVDHIGGLVKALEDHEEAGESYLIVDVTGTGRAVGNLMVESGLKPVRVTITAGMEEASPHYGEWRVPKTDLVGGLQIAYQADRLKMAAELELVPTLVAELQNFKLRPPVINDTDPESWRESQYDDLVFAVALAVWRTTKYTPTRQTEDHGAPRQIREDAWMG